MLDRLSSTTTPSKEANGGVPSIVWSQAANFGVPGASLQTYLTPPSTVRPSTTGYRSRPAAEPDHSSQMHALCRTHATPNPCVCVYVCGRRSTKATLNDETQTVPNVSAALGGRERARVHA